MSSIDRRERSRWNSMSFFPINPADTLRKICRGSKRIFRRGRLLLKSLSAAKAPRVLCGQSGVTERILTRGHRLTTTASRNCSSRSKESRWIYHCHSQSSWRKWLKNQERSRIIKFYNIKKNLSFSLSFEIFLKNKYRGDYIHTDTYSLIFRQYYTL